MILIAPKMLDGWLQDDFSPYFVSFVTAIDNNIFTTSDSIRSCLGSRRIEYIVCAKTAFFTKACKSLVLY